MSTIISPKIYEILKKAVNENIDNFVISVDDPKKKGEGFLGQIFFVVLKNKHTGEEMNFVVKQAFSGSKLRNFKPVRDVFLNETYFYTNLWPSFSKFQERIPTEHRFAQLVKYFAAISEENFERLLLENVRSQGFVMHDKTKVLEKEQFEFIFKVYGKFHAISFAYKALDGEGFLELIKGIVDPWKMFCQKQDFSDGIKFTYECCIKCFEPGADDDIIEKFRHYVDDGIDLFRKSLDCRKYTAVIHGDSWGNNIMFKYDDIGKLADIKILDFQMFRVGSPVFDLAYCLYSGASKEVLDDLENLLQVYHDSLSENLREYGCDPNVLFPLEALKNDWKVHCQFGVGMSFMLWRSKLTYDDALVDFSDMCEDEQGGIKKYFDANYDEITFKKRIRDIVIHLYENDYLI